MSARHDRGLRAVSRVRDVRERDSRIGLQQALREEASLQSRLDVLEEAMRTHGAFISGDMRQFVALQQSLEALRGAAKEAREAADAATVISASARSHWHHDKTRLSAVEGLLERRADERRAEVEKKESHELDDVAGRLWLRAKTQHTQNARKEAAS